MRYSPTKAKRLEFRVSENLYDSFSIFCQDQFIFKSVALRRAIEEYMANHENDDELIPNN